jgi:hypothetical protein
MYVPLTALTTQTTEGTVGSGVSVNVLTTTATIGEYARQFVEKVLGQFSPQFAFAI